MNKVKPFYIRITDDMTPQMVQDAFDKCVDAGVRPDEALKQTKQRHKYESNLSSRYAMFGVMSGRTFLGDHSCHFGVGAKEITLNQLDGWLGFEKGAEWRNGDECVIRGEKLIYIGESIEVDIHCVQELGTCIYRNAHISVIEKPETPEQKAEREAVEQLTELLDSMQGLDKMNNKTKAKTVLAWMTENGYSKK